MARLSAGAAQSGEVAGWKTSATDDRLQENKSRWRESGERSKQAVVSDRFLLVPTRLRLIFLGQGVPGNALVERMHQGNFGEFLPHRRFSWRGLGVRNLVRLAKDAAIVPCLASVFSLAQKISAPPP